MQRFEPAHGFIGREPECSELTQAIAATRAGHGRLLLLSGEAGIGKTRLARQALDQSDLLVLLGAAHRNVPLPYGPLLSAMRSAGDLLDAIDAPDLAPALTAILHGAAPAAPADRAALVEELRLVLSAIARRRPAAVFLDDLHWADAATLECLPALADALVEQPLLLVGAYRSDELPRDHPLRRLRSDLRRAGRLAEVALQPFEPRQTAELLAQVLGAQPSSVLTAAIHDRTDGVPFYIEEFAAALSASGRLENSPGGLTVDTGRLPLPESVSDAMLVRLGGLPEPARAALDAAAVAGQEFDLDLVAAVIGDAGAVAELLRRGLLVEVAPGRAAFRHVLFREACYGEIVWPARRALHRRVAEWLEANRAPAAVVAEHWLAAREPEPARRAFLAAAADDRAVHAYRDAARALQHALELWPDGDEADRLATLERLGECAELCGDLAGAARAWREALAGAGETLAGPALATLERRLAGVYELQGDWERALAARQCAAERFAAAGLPAEAATERLQAAAHLRSAASFSPALTLLERARAEADRTERLDLQARILGLTGNVLARQGEREVGLELLREALALALERQLTVPAAEIYQRLADALEHGGDYAGAKAMYQTGFAFCQAHAVPTTAQLCLACLTVVLRQTGEWERAEAFCRDVLADPASSAHARAAASSSLGAILALRGRPRQARPLLLDALALARGIELVAAELLSIWGLALVDSLSGKPEEALARCRTLLERWPLTEERHYMVAVLHWMATFAAEQATGDLLHGCAAALASIFAATGQAEALAALAHALGEVALREQDYPGAAAQFDRALEVLREHDLPLERAATGRRAGMALVLAGERAAGVDRLCEAYRTARQLGARPLATQIARDLDALGEPVERHLGRQAAGQLAHGGLTRREMDVLRLVAVGRTSREIADTLFLSPRTVEMHVEHLLRKLECDTRAAAVHKAAGLGLV